MGERPRRSKRRSAGRSSRKRRETELAFFFDENFSSKSTKEVSSELDVRVEVYPDWFEPGIPDHKWIPEVTRKGWVIVTPDRRIRYKPNEIEAVTRVGARMFSFSGQLTGQDQAELFVKALPRMRRVLRTTDGPFIATVTKDGKVTVRWPKPDRDS